MTADGNLAHDGARVRVDDDERVGDAVRHVERLPRLERETARAPLVSRVRERAARRRRQLDARRHRAVVSIHQRDAVGAKGSEEVVGPARSEGHGDGLRERVGLILEAWEIGVVEAGVQIEACDRTAADIDATDLVCDEGAAQLRLEASEVPRIRVRDVEIAADRAHSQSQVNRADAGEVARDRQRGDVDLHHVVVRHGELDGSAGAVRPGRVGGIDDQSHVRRRGQAGAHLVGGLRRRIVRGQNGRAVAREGEGGIDLGAVQADSERARVFAEDGNVGDRRAREYVEDGDLIAPSRGDKGASAGEHHVRRLVLHRERFHHGMA